MWSDKFTWTSESLDSFWNILVDLACD
jgi:hypothetical protein